jgi:tagatose kinase
MPDLFTFGEALVEIMRTGIDVPLHVPGAFTGPYPSGAPFIFAVQAARLGATVGVCGCIGADTDGQPDALGWCLLDQLASDDIDAAAMIPLPGQTTGAAFVAYRGDGGRDFVFHLRHAAAGQLAPALAKHPVVLAQFNGLRCIHVMGSSLSMHDDALALGITLVEMAQAAGAKISFDPNLRPQLLPANAARTAFAPFFAAADVILPTADEAMLLTGRATPDEAAYDLLAGRAGRIVVLTHGAAGCTVYTTESRVDVQGFLVEEADPTGAGDCFDAGFLVRWLAGDSPTQAARWANACGALAVTERGPMAGARHARDVAAFMLSATRHQQEER